MRLRQTERHGIGQDEARGSAAAAAAAAAAVESDTEAETETGSVRFGRNMGCAVKSSGPEPAVPGGWTTIP